MIASSYVMAAVRANIVPWRFLTINVLYCNERGKVEFYLWDRLAWVSLPEPRMVLDAEGHFLSCEWIQAQLRWKCDEGSQL